MYGRKKEDAEKVSQAEADDKKNKRNLREEGEDAAAFGFSKSLFHSKNYHIRIILPYYSFPPVVGVSIAFL